MNVGIYVRVSTEDRAREGHSLDEQEVGLKTSVLPKIIRYLKYIRMLV